MGVDIMEQRLEHFGTNFSLILQLCGEQLLKLVRGSLCAKGFGSSNVQLIACLRRSILPRSTVLVLSTVALLGVRMYVMGSQLPVFTR